MEGILHSTADIERVVDYIRKNPLKEGLPEQNWSFVTPYDGWLPSNRWRSKR